jgi:hypothetical protein
MPDRHPRLVKNSKGRKCKRCTGVHNYVTRLSDDASCDTPVAFSLDKARVMVNLIATDENDIVRVPDDTVVVLDDSARKLPRKGSEGPIQFAQFTRTERMA